jgi:phosphatidylglycerophosphatase C
VTSSAPCAVAVFDFDGTLSRRDTLVGFLRLVAGTTQLACSLLAAGPDLIAGWRDAARRDAAKEYVLARCLAGRRDAHLRALGRRYSRYLLTSQLRPDAHARLAAHRDAGHELVLCSASLTYYLEPLADRLGFHAVLATAMEVGPDGRCTGRLLRPNVRGAEKVRRLEEWLAGREAIVHAYGDSDGDAELLARADHATWVGRRARRGASPIRTATHSTAAYRRPP